MHTENIRSAWVAWVENRGFTHAITLKPNNPNYTPTSAFLRKSLRHCHAMIDREILGTSFNKPSLKDKRTLFVCIEEGFPENGHLHILAKPHYTVLERFEKICRGNRLSLWDELITGGTSRVDQLIDAAGWARYATKNIRNLDAFDNFILLP